MGAPVPSSPSSNSTSTRSTSSQPHSSSSVIEFYSEPNLHDDIFPLGQPDDDSERLSLPNIAIPTSYFNDLDDESSVDTAHSSLSLHSTSSTEASTQSESSNDPSMTEDPVPVQPRANPGRLNEAWRTFFRDSLVADDPTKRPVDTATAHGGTPVPLPPPIRAPPNVPSGDPFENKTRNSFRIWSVNANGISTKDHFAELHALCISLRSRSVDAIAIQEPNLDFMKADIREKYKDIFKEHFGQARVITATTCIAAPRAWKPGGVTLVILGPWAQYVAKTSCDDLGRWVSATLTGSDGDSFTLFSMYNVVDTNLRDAGPSTVCSQQYRLLRLARMTYPVPCQQCVDSLNQAVRQLIADNDSIVIVGDFNETLGTNPKLMASVCAEHNLFDVHDHFHGIGANIPTYARGTKRLDYGVASPNLEPYIDACGYNLFNKHLHSDHRASFMDIRLKEFSGHETPRLASPDQRFMSTSSPDVLKFVQKCTPISMKTRHFTNTKTSALTSTLLTNHGSRRIISTRCSDKPLRPQKNSARSTHARPGRRNCTMRACESATGRSFSQNVAPGSRRPQYCADLSPRSGWGKPLRQYHKVPESCKMLLLPPSALCVESVDKP
jgi:hypothetical protein